MTKTYTVSKIGTRHNGTEWQVKLEARFSDGRVTRYHLGGRAYGSLVHSANCRGTGLKGAVSRFLIGHSTVRFGYIPGRWVKKGLVEVETISPPRDRNEELTNDGSSADMFAAEIARRAA